METPKTLQQAVRYFSDEQVCINTIAQMRWPTGPVCPKCEGAEHYYLKTQKRWKCKKCSKQFSVKLGTIFEDSPISLDKWLVALWMLVNCKNGISSYEVGRDLGITQKSAWFVLQRLRLALQEKSLVKLGGEGKTVEVDETSSVACPAICTKKFALERSRELVEEIKLVVGFLERGGKVRTSVPNNRRKHTMHKEVKQNVSAGSILFTDELKSYNDLAEEFAHKVINHAVAYVDGNVHTNNLENYWSLVKRGLKGTYISVEPFHLFRYLGEQAFRYNNRSRKDNLINDGDRFDLALSQIAGKRLTFAEVTGKVGAADF